MLFPALGMTASIWLMTAPLLALETGFRAELTVAVGITTLVLSPLTLWSRRAGIAVTSLGVLLGFANLVLLAPLGAGASLASCAVGLIAAGMAPRPIRMAAAAAAADAAVAGEVGPDEITERLMSAAA
jgi:hypothetical protein